MWVDVDTAITVPVNIFPLTDDTDFKTREVAIAYDESGMDLVWNFQTTAGVTSQTAVTPTTAGVYDWTHSGDGMYKIEIPASAGGSINNDAEGTGWFIGLCDGVLAWRGPEIHFRAAGLNNALIDSAYSATRGLAGTALPDAVADAGGGLPISDVGGLDLDTLLGYLTAAVATAAALVTAQNDLDLLTGADGAVLAASQPNYAPNTVVPDVAGTAPTAVENRQEMDSNSTQLAAIIADTLPLGYLGPEGYGIYVDDAAANTNTVNGVDGIFSNPVSTFTAARTLADSLGIEIYYILNNSELTLAATHVDWEFVGFGAMTDNTINLGSQDVSRSRFLNVVLEGTQGGSGRIEAEKCALQDPGPGVSTFHLFALNCGIVDDITLDTSNDNVFIDCFSLVAGNSAPIVRASGASGTLQMRGQKGGVDLRDLSASHNVSLEQVGQVIFDASCNVNANVTLRGIGSKTDNTAGMSNLTEEAYINMPKTNTEADAALTDFFTSSAQLVDDFWDEVISKAAHDVAQSAAKILRLTGDLIQIDGSVSDGSPTTTDFDTTLTQGDDYFNDSVLVFVNGAANAGIGKHVSAYLNANGNVTFVADMAWPVTPVNGDDFVIVALHEHPITEVQAGLATEAKQDIMGTNVDSILEDTNELQTDDVPSLIAAVQGDTNDLQTRLPAALISGKMDSDVEAINDNAASADNLAASALGIVPGVCEGTPTTTVIQTDLAEATDDHYIGRLVLFTSGAAAGQASIIEDYTGATGTLTITAITTAPVATDTFVIV